MNADPGDRERFGAMRGTAFMIAEGCSPSWIVVHDRGRSQWLEIDRKAEDVIWGFLPPGSAVDAKREDLRVGVEAAYRAANPVKPVGSGVSELRVDYWPGYRVYVMQRGPVLAVLLCGGHSELRMRTKRAMKISKDWKG